MTKKHEISGLAILARGFWSYSSFYEGNPLPVEVQTKWIVFAGKGEPFMGDYVDFYNDNPLSELLSQETIDNARRYDDDLIKYRRKLLMGLDIYDSIESDEDIALWSIDYKAINSTTPKLLHTDGEEYYKDYLGKYRLAKGAFVEGNTDDKRGSAFAIVDLLESRATIIAKDGSFSMIKKPYGERIVTKKGRL